MRCCVNNCDSYYRREKGKNSSISFHKFPVDLIWRQRWIDICREWNTNQSWLPKNSSRICSRHFQNHFFINMQRRLLGANAIPTIFIKYSIGSETMGEDNNKCNEEVNLMEGCLETISVETTVHHEVPVLDIPSTSHDVFHSAHPTKQPAASCSSESLDSDMDFGLASKEQKHKIKLDTVLIRKPNKENVNPNIDSQFETPTPSKSNASPSKSYSSDPSNSSDSQMEFLLVPMTKEDIKRKSISVSPLEASHSTINLESNMENFVYGETTDDVNKRIKIDHLRETTEDISHPIPSTSSVLSANTMTLKKALISTPDDATSAALSPNKRILREKQKKHVLRRTVQSQRKKIKVLNQKCRRKSKKLVSLRQMFETLRDKNLASTELIDLLSAIAGPNKDIIQRQVLRAKGLPVPKNYEVKLRAFALNLHFLSPKAYKYVRDTFDSCLPSIATIHNWYKSIKCNPGFTSESFVAIKQAALEAKKVSQKLVVNVVFDEMHIRQYVDWQQSDALGYVDIGDGGESRIQATQVLVFMVVCINRSWKIPIGYFPIAYLNGEQKKVLIVNAIKLTLQTGVEVVGVTFDGASQNIAAMRELGCDLHDTSSPRLFSLPDIENKESQFLVIPDPCHMLKLIRNALASLKVIVDKDNNKIEWGFLEKLLRLQEKEELHLGNKLRSAHVFFHDQKMKVKLAVNTMSKSVADALDFCRITLKLEDFANSKPTADFLRNFNDIFDVLNSRKITDFSYKKALCLDNADSLLKFANSKVNYIKTLKTMEGKLLIRHPKNTGFIGLCAALNNLTLLHDRFIRTGLLKYIPVYKLNQDHIELFFGSVRSSLGNNNNPSIVQFISAYKKLLVRCQIRENGIGNCVPLEEISILQCASISFDPIIELNSSSKNQMLKDDLENDNRDMDIFFEELPAWKHHDYIFNPSDLSEYVTHVVKYMAGFVVFKVQKKINCIDCISALQGSLESESKRNCLIVYKSKGFLQIPSDSTEEICIMAERVLRTQIHLLNQETANSTVLRKKYFNKILIEVQKRLLHKNLFPLYSTHMFENNHYSLLIKIILDKYLNTRYFFIAKKASEKKSVRNKYNKLILFQGM